FHLHLVSDATGETVHSVARACFVQFDGIEPTEHHWPLVRTKGQIDKILRKIEEHPGIVLFTIVKEDLRTALEIGCSRLHIPCISVLDPVIHALTAFLGLQSSGKSGRQHILDAEYFDRIDAMTYTLNHDDGQSTHDLADADVILVGVSRTSKTPTCIYLANRGLKAANVPVVPDIRLPPEFDTLTDGAGPLIVGLTTDPKRLVQVRRNRLRLLDHNADTDYVDPETVKDEVATARRLFSERDWPVIDVTRRSIEETAATILQILERQRDANA
ncbi:MAG: pyruvate, water dikinase regulatory protein, partial [Rickettsiales bacterium]